MPVYFWPFFGDGIKRPDSWSGGTEGRLKDWRKKKEKETVIEIKFYVYDLSSGSNDR